MKNVIDRSRIDFPRRVSYQRLESLFGYLGEKLRAEIEYHPEVIRKIGVDRFTKRKLDETDIWRVGGTFQFVSDILSFSAPREVPGGYAGIQFDMIPGYSEEELRRTHSSNIDLVDVVRTFVKRYFQRGERR